ncbi:MAG: polysaccharide biosynthesis protein [Clostridiales bacterium]|jgi:stage V sporulation protein B|nr:polysaccharide biosynthesis protein [Clostridiales bacterium]
MKTRSMITGALILTGAGVITRVLGFVYRVYMSNVLGAEGMGLYQLIMPMYALAWSIACSGFNTVVSKVIAQERAKREYGNMGMVLKQSVIITSSVGLVLSVSLYFLAEVAAAYVFKDMRTIIALKILSLAFPFMAAGTCVRGYFLGLQETLVPAINQVLEQTVRMITIYFLASFFVPRGLEYACAVAVIGIVAEEIVSFIYIFVSYRKFKSKHKLVSRPSLTARQSLGMIMGMAVPLTANRVSGSLLSALENILIPQRLQLFGMTQGEAMSVFGRLSGMAMPLIYFPTALLTSLSITIVPAVSESLALGRMSSIRLTVSKSLLFAGISGVGASALFICFPDELGLVFYNQPIGDMLFLLGLMCPFLYVQIIFAGVLNGLGNQLFIFKISLISSAINICCIYFLVPMFGVHAFMGGWFASLVVSCSMEVYKIIKTISIDIDLTNWLLKPGLSAAAAGLTARYINSNYLQPAFGKFGVLASIALLFALFATFIVLTGVLNKEDIGRFINRKPAMG